MRMDNSLNKLPVANKGFAIAGVPCFAETFVKGGSLALRMKFSAKTPRHRKPPKPLCSSLKDNTIDNETNNDSNRIRKRV